MWSNISFSVGLWTCCHVRALTLEPSRKWARVLPLPLASAAAAKSRQSCQTLCDPINGSPPGPRPWDSPDKNTGVGCHCLLQCMKVKSENEVTQSCLTLRNHMDRSLPGSSVHGIFQARVLEWGAIAFSLPLTSCVLLGMCMSLRRPQVLRLYSVRFSCSVVSDSLRPHELQHSRPCCPSPTPGVQPCSSILRG